jgi:hypothetical protein
LHIPNRCGLDVGDNHAVSTNSSTRAATARHPEVD